MHLLNPVHCDMFLFKSKLVDSFPKGGKKVSQTEQDIGKGKYDKDFLDKLFIHDLVYYPAFSHVLKLS